MLSAPFVIPLYEAFIRLYDLIDRSPANAIEDSLTALSLLAFVPFGCYAVMLAASEPTNGLVSLMGSICSALALILGFVTLFVAQRESRLHQERANRAAQYRQTRHVRAEVNAAVRRSLDLRRLRHDLANQIDVVGELAAHGHAREADRYLAALQQLAHDVSGAHHA